MQDKQNLLEDLKKRLLAVIDGYKTTFGKNKPTDNVDNNSQLKTEFNKIAAQVKTLQQSKDQNERERIAFELGQLIENWEDLYNAANDSMKKESAQLSSSIQKLKKQLGGTKSESKTETPAEATTETPAEATTETPAESTTETPAESTTETPAESTTETPAESKTETPAESTTETPAESTTETPAESTTETPAESTTETPAESKTETPAESTTETPAESKTETPAESTTETPAESTTETPAESKTETPAEAKTETPAEAKTEEAKPVAVVASTSLTASVGEKGTNKPEDVLLIKTLINKFIKAFDLNDVPNSTKVGPTTVGVIKKFQQEKVGLTAPDGLVEVGGKTWKVLSGETKPVEATPANTNPVGAGGNFNEAIHNAAKSLQGMDTSSGPDGGNLACAWAVTKVLKKAGVAPIGSNTNYVPSVLDALKGGRGRPITKAEVLPGDIVIASNIGHIGIAMSNGAGQVLSNSSSRRAFRWMSGPNFDGYYGSGSSTFYRVIN